MRFKRYFDLHLLAARNTAMKSPRVIENSVHHRVVFIGDGPRELAPDEVVRDVAQQLEIRTLVEQIEREVQIGRHPVTVRFDVHGKIDLFREPRPAIDQRQAFSDAARPHVRLQIDMVNPEFGGEFKHRLQVVDRTRKALRFRMKTSGREQTGDLPDSFTRRVTYAYAVETGPRNHLDVLFERALVAVGMGS